VSIGYTKSLTIDALSGIIAYENRYSHECLEQVFVYERESFHRQSTDKEAGMSRGLGKTQRAILAELKQGPARTDEIAKSVYRTSHPTRAQIVTVRRAIRTLEQSHLVECGEYYSDTGKLDQFGRHIHNLYLFAWLPENRPEKEPVQRFDTTQVESLILEYLARHGATRRYDLSRITRRQLQEQYGRHLYTYESRYRRALQRLVAQGAVRLYTDKWWTEVVEMTRHLISVTM
jgi:hypothetical protein